jgi:hypothetical protein
MTLAHAMTVREARDRYLAEFGLSVEKLAPMFERYLSRYEVEREG